MNYPTYASHSFKMVILTDDALQWSPLAIINGEQNIKNQKQFKVQKLSTNLDSQNRYSIFEMPMKSVSMSFFV